MHSYHPLCCFNTSKLTQFHPQSISNGNSRQFETAQLLVAFSSTTIELGGGCCSNVLYHYIGIFHPLFCDYIYNLRVLSSDAASWVIFHRHRCASITTPCLLCTSAHQTGFISFHFISSPFIFTSLHFIFTIGNCCIIMFVVHPHHFKQNTTCSFHTYPSAPSHKPYTLSLLVGSLGNLINSFEGVHCYFSTPVYICYLW